MGGKIVVEGSRDTSALSNFAITLVRTAHERTLVLDASVRYYRSYDQGVPESLRIVRMLQRADPDGSHLLSTRERFLVLLRFETRLGEDGIEGLLRDGFRSWEGAMGRAVAHWNGSRLEEMRRELTRVDQVIDDLRAVAEVASRYARSLSEGSQEGIGMIFRGQLEALISVGLKLKQRRTLPPPWILVCLIVGGLTLGIHSADSSDRC